MFKGKKIGIIDYGLSNLFSIKRVLEHIGAEPIIIDNPGNFSLCDRLILPGVGSFGDGMKGLKERNLIEPIKEAADSGIPILGICLGMQLFMSRGEEFGTHEGLDLIKGKVVKLKKPAPSEPYFKIPHIGWSSLLYPDVKSAGKTGENLWKKTLLEDFRENVFMYFVHSYKVVPYNPDNIIAETRYSDDRFCSVVSKGNISGCQFHPERSGEDGIRIYRKFIAEE